jgi:hypothetical protein
MGVKLHEYKCIASLVIFLLTRWPMGDPWTTPHQANELNAFPHDAEWCLGARRLAKKVLGGPTHLPSPHPSGSLGGKDQVGIQPASSEVLLPGSEPESETAVAMCVSILSLTLHLALNTTSVLVVSCCLPNGSCRIVWTGEDVSHQSFLSRPLPARRK